MKTFALLLTLSIALFTACGPSGIAKQEMEKFSGTPMPSITPTPEQSPIPPGDIVQVDTSQDGPILTVNNEPKKALNCDHYNQVAINADNSTVTIKGACMKVTVNGDGNQITAEAALEFAFNGSGNTVKFSKFSNGKQPTVTQNQGGNTVEFSRNEMPAGNKIKK